MENEKKERTPHFELTYQPIHSFYFPTFFQAGERTVVCFPASLGIAGLMANFKDLFIFAVVIES